MTRPLGGLALIAGGALWIVAAVSLAAKPYGDSAGVRLLRPTEPLSTTYRSGEELASILALAVIFTLTGLGLLHARAAWASGRLGRAAVVLLALGALVAAPYLEPLGELPIPLFLLGLASWSFGMLALAAAALRRDVLIRSAAYMLIAAIALLFFSNTEDDRALLLMGQAPAWIWLGIHGLMPRPGAAPARG